MSILFIISNLQTIYAEDQNINPTTDGGIKNAIDNANSGDTVNLAPGIYNKTNQDTNITISKSITIKGNGATKDIIIDAKKISRIYTMGANINIKFINITFINGYTNGNGGAIVNNIAMMTFINCSFINNTAIKTTTNGGGGAIYNSANNVIVVNSSFTNNNAIGDGTGGAIYNKGDDFTIINSYFTYNTAKDGGAIYNDYADRLTVINSNFIGNTAEDGGAIHNVGDKLNFSVLGSTFINNSVNGSYGGYGGAIFNTAPNFTVESSTFIGNTAYSGGTNGNAGGYGGSIWTSSKNFNANNSTFINNSANSGGAIYMQQTPTNCSVVNSTFINNTANSGGAITNAGPNFSVTNSTFIGNTAKGEGGAIRNTGGNFTVTNSIFTNNSANNGGAISNAYLNTGSNTTIANSTFIANTATTNGGAIYNIANMTVFGNVMTNNKAGLGNMIYNTGHMGILNLTYLNNSTIYVVKGQKIILFATLTDDMGNTVTGRIITFMVNGINIGSVTSIEGNVNISYTVADIIGLVTVSGDYNGHANYPITLLNGQLRVAIETNSTINTPDNGKVGEKINIIGTATDEFGNPIANTIINVTVNGISYTVTTDSNGNWILQYTITQTGNIIVTVQWDGNESHLGFINSTLFYVAEDDYNSTDEKTPTNSTIIVPDNTKIGQNINITGTAKDELGNPIANTIINVTVNGISYTVTTDSNGNWILQYTITQTGNIIVTVQWDGNESHFGFINSTLFYVAEDDYNSTDENKTNNTDNNTENENFDDDSDDDELNFDDDSDEDSAEDNTDKTEENDNIRDPKDVFNVHASMKSTGVNIAILLILTILMLVTYRRKSK